MGSDEAAVATLSQRLASLRAMRDWAGALDLARQLAALEPEDGEHWFWVARALEETRDPPGAFAAYQEALNRRLGDEEIRSAAEVGRERVKGPVAEAERRRTEKDAARARREEALRTIAELSSFNAAIDTATRARDGDLEIALAAAARALELAADDRDKRVIALTVEGATLRRAGRVTDAVDALEEAVSLNSSVVENYRAYTALVAALRQAGELRPAVQHVEEVLKVRPDDSYMLWAAVALFTAIHHEDNRPSALERAQVYAERAARVAPEERNAPRYLEALADAFERFGETERAAKLRALVELLPDRPGRWTGSEFV